MDHLPEPLKAGKLRDLKSIRAAEEMAVDPEESSAMEVVDEDEKAKKRSHPLSVSIPLSHECGRC